jgi:excisionase family DNA binding protein
LKAAASILNIHENTLRKWADTGVLRSYRIGRRCDRRFLERDLEAFICSSRDAKA